MLPFLFDFFELKERARIKRKINSQRKAFISDINITIMKMIWRKLRSSEPVQQKIKLPSPNR